MKKLFNPDQIKYLANRFAERCPGAEEGVTPDAFPLIDTMLEVIADRCYPTSGMGVENAHVVTMSDPADADSNVTGILIEFELDDDVTPSPLLIAAMLMLDELAGDNITYLAFGGGLKPGTNTWYDRWCVGVFFPLNYAVKYGAPEVQRHADRLGALLY